MVEAESRLLLGMFAEEVSDAQFIHLPFRHRKHRLDERLIRHFRFCAIHGERMACPTSEPSEQVSSSFSLEACL